MMLNRRQICRWCFGFGIVIAALDPGAADAEPLHVRDSSPAAETIIRGRHAEYVIRFDGPVDHAAARMELVQSDQVVRTLTPLGDSAPDVLFASGEMPPPGHYILRWQVHSPQDGTVSRGDIPFWVEEPKS